MAPTHQVMYNVIDRVPFRIPSAVLCLILLPIQAAVLNYYMVDHLSKLYWLWFIADTAVFVVFLIAFVFSFRHLKKSTNLRDHEHRKSKSPRAGELPLGWIAWLFYSLVLSSKVMILFQEIAQRLKEVDYFGPNTLKIAIASAAFIFMLLVTTHNDAEHGSTREAFINLITKTCTFDILDTTAILDVLFLENSHVFLTFGMHRTILAIAFVNLVLPTVHLLVLSRSRFGRESMTPALKIMHSFIYLICVNVPLFIVRLILWHVKNQNVSVFIIKNVLGIAFTIKMIYGIWREKIDQVDGLKVKADDVEMRDFSPARSEEGPSNDERLAKKDVPQTVL